MTEVLRSNFEGIVHILNDVMLQANPVMGSHARRCSGLGRSVAAGLKLNPDRRRLVFYAATLHDISLIGKKEDWTGMDSSAWLEHPEQSAALVKTVPNLNRIAAVIAAHHELMDGSGFPLGLTGRQIPVESRIIAAVVEFDRQTAIQGQKTQDVLADMQDSGKFDDDVMIILGTIINENTAQRKSGDRLVGTDDLIPGMILADDLILRSGMLLFTAETSLDENALERIRSFEEMLDSERLIRVYPGR